MTSSSLSVFLLFCLIAATLSMAPPIFNGTPEGSRIIEALGTSHVHRDGEVDETDIEMVYQMEKQILERELEDFVFQLDDEELEALEERLEEIIEGDYVGDMESKMILKQLSMIGLGDDDLREFNILADDMTIFLSTIPTMRTKLGLSGEDLADNVKMYLLGLDNELGPIGFLALHRLIRGDEVEVVAETLGPEYSVEMRKRREAMEKMEGEYRRMGDEGYGEEHGSGSDRRRRDAFDKMMMDRVVDMRMQDYKDQDAGADERRRRDTMEKMMDGAENMGEYMHHDDGGYRRRRDTMEKMMMDGAENMGESMYHDDSGYRRRRRDTMDKMMMEGVKNMDEYKYGDMEGSQTDNMERKRRETMDKMMMEGVQNMDEYKYGYMEGSQTDSVERRRRETMDKMMMEGVQNMDEYKYGDMEGSQTDNMERRRRALLEGIGEQVDMAYEQEKRKKRSLGKMVF